MCKDFAYIEFGYVFTSEVGLFHPQVLLGKARIHLINNDIPELGELGNLGLKLWEREIFVPP